MKYKIGDRVKVKEDLKCNGVKYYMLNKDGSRSDKRNTVTRRMFFLSGNIVTISGYEDGQYNLKEDYDGFGWTDEMFEGLEADYAWDLFEDLGKTSEFEILVNMYTIKKNNVSVLVADNNLTIDEYIEFKDLDDLICVLQEIKNRIK